MDILKQVRRTGLVGLAAVLMASTSALAQDGAVEEVVVTGSYIKQTPGDAPLPVDVMNDQDLFDVGSPSITEMIKSMNTSSGTDGETNQFQSNGLEGTSNINLRGLGSGRNLVLLNGRRNVFHPYAIAEQAQLFVNTNNIPSIAIQRVETLKDGAAATYGSDAISGVVNFITRSDFEGLEVTASHKSIDGSDGDQDFGLIYGTSLNGGNTRVVASFGMNTRSQLMVKDRDWAIHERAENGNFTGYSSSPHPGSYVGVDANGLPIEATKYIDPDCANVVGYFPLHHFSNINVPAYLAYAGAGLLDTPLASGSGDPTAATGASAATNSSRCTYNYTYFDNLIEEEERTNAFVEFEHQLGDMTLSGELLMAETDVPNWYTSPTYPPQTDYDTDPRISRVVKSDHPGLVDMLAEFPDSALATYVNANCALGTDADCLYYRGRPFGASGPGETRGSRNYKTNRLVLALDGSRGDIDYTTSFTYSTSEGNNRSYDTITERWSAAIEGLGGPNCDRATGTPGAGDCYYYNPFTNAIQYGQQKYTSYTAGNPNPNYNADVANNTDVLIPWMTEPLGSKVDSELTVFDAVFTGPGFSDMVSWAAGIQLRSENYDIAPLATTDLNQYPCRTDAENTEFRNSGRTYSNAQGTDNCAGADGIFGGAGAADDYQGAGRYIFLAGTTPSSQSQDITALFGELAISPSDELDIQLSARYEDYGSSIGSSFDPKVAVRYQLADSITLRGSASTTFRGPTLNQLSGRGTSLSYVNALGTFKAVDTDGNPNLEPESANTFNIGAIFQMEDALRENDSIFASVDYWSFNFKDPIIKENFNSIVSNVFPGNVGSAAADYYNRITCGTGGCDGLDVATLSRINVKIINGPDIDTDGLDIAVKYGFDLFDGRAEISANATQVMSYDVAEGALPSALTQYGGDAVGRLNDDMSFLRPIVEWKAKLGARYALDRHVVNLVMNYTDSYKDSESIVGIPLVARMIEEQTTYDLHYNVDVSDMLNSDGSALYLSVYNIADEDPPMVRRDLSYDPYTHNPFGRMVKLGLKHSF